MGPSGLLFLLEKLKSPSGSLGGGPLSTEYTLVYFQSTPQMKVSPVHDRGITIRIDDEEVKKEVKRAEEGEKETEGGEDEETEEETEEEDEEDEDEDEEDEEGSDEETFGFRPQKKPAPAPVFVPQPKKTFYWIAPFDE